MHESRWEASSDTGESMHSAEMKMPKRRMEASNATYLSDPAASCSRRWFLRSSMGRLLYLSLPRHDHGHGLVHLRVHRRPALPHSFRCFAICS